MGRFSKSLFGEAPLPERCIIYAGAYFPERKEWVRGVFEKWSRIKGSWVKYTFAVKNGKKYLLLFNVYGGAMTLEVLYLLKDGDVRKVFLAGSLGGKDIRIGTLVIPVKVIDKTGLVFVNNLKEQVVKPKSDSIKRLKRVLEIRRINNVEGQIVSVPCVLHNISHVREFVEQNPNILGVELETSTFYYYSQKEGFESYALLYISDNKRHDIISEAKSVQEARKTALKTITYVAIEVLK